VLAVWALALSGGFASLTAGAGNDVACFGERRLGVLPQCNVVLLEHP
jgi:hypothetical protein